MIYAQRKEESMLWILELQQMSGSYTAVAAPTSRKKNHVVGTPATSPLDACVRLRGR